MIWKDDDDGDKVGDHDDLWKILVTVSLWCIFSEIIADLKKQVHQLHTELIVSSQQSLSQEQQLQLLLADKDRMKATYDQQIEDFSRSILVEKKNLQSELARTKLEYELQLELIN